MRTALQRDGWIAPDKLGTWFSVRSRERLSRDAHPGTCQFASRDISQKRGPKAGRRREKIEKLASVGQPIDVCRRITLGELGQERFPPVAQKLECHGKDRSDFLDPLLVREARFESQPIRVNPL